MWLLLFSALALVSTDPTPRGNRARFQPGLVSGDRTEGPVVQFDRGAVWATMIKLALCYLLIGWTGGITSTYYVTLLLPVVSAATTLNLAGTSLITVLAISAYLSFLLFSTGRATS